MMRLLKFVEQVRNPGTQFNKSYQGFKMEDSAYDFAIYALLNWEQCDRAMWPKDSDEYAPDIKLT